MVTALESSLAVPLIQLRALDKYYGGAHGAPRAQVLQDIHLSVYAGEFVAVVGPSGSGKSTLMHILGCLDKPSAGQYLFEGQNVSLLNADELARLRREAFGFVFQGYHLLAENTALENVQLPAIYAGMGEAARHARATTLLTQLDLGKRLQHRPGQLSGGQQQRVSIARALMNGGRIILADEPTGALDSRSSEQVMVLLRQLAQAGHTIILITHDAKVAQQAERIVEIRDGRILSDSAAASDTCVQDPPKPAACPESWTSNDGAHAVKGVPPVPVMPVLQAPSQSQLQSHHPPDHNSNVFRAELREALRMAWRGMRMNAVRTGLTLLGIIIGVASVIVMLAVGEGSRQTVMGQMGAMGSTIMYMGSSFPPAGGPRGQLSEADLEALAALPELQHVMPVIGDPIIVRYANAARQNYVYAAAAVMPEVHHWKVKKGRYFTASEDRGLAPVVVLGHKAWKFFFPDMDNPLGRQLLIGSASFEVIGIMSERGADSGLQDYDDMVFIPYQAGRARVYQAQTQPDYVVVQVRTSALVLQAEQSIRTELLARHGGREDFSIGNAAARLLAEAQARDSMTLMLGLIAAVSLLVGGIGVMNVMLMTVSERTREIGIRVATGARQRDILRQFLVEALLLTVSGGAAGVFCGIVIGILLLLAGVPLIFSLTAILGAFFCAVITGIVFGYVPAKNAARLDPVRALEAR
ncbi:MacB family efflux pump subunit [Advenella mimigardefordensis]|uniref:Pyoverdine export ATP-binding/permease protein PvdT n=1 Tax=Advenella mimigardefordensis (strain DSM 17166 / LMG 22922 / DPN7) TaxID=1247726 RepID=W0PI78_ADVMD|nr:MacB family efflux pump subunit [Advenella mimigardefordensis]AHG64633.1 putative macrolide export ATP-binding/permease protein MacB [Advenella mimigardefordensis DPN7]